MRGTRKRACRGHECEKQKQQLLDGQRGHKGWGGSTNLNNETTQKRKTKPNGTCADEKSVEKRIRQIGGTCTTGPHTQS